MSALTVLTALLAALQSAGIIGSFAATVLTEAGVSTSAVTILKTVCATITQADKVTDAIKALAAQIAEWCDGDTSYTVADLVALCDKAADQSETIQGLS